LGKKITLGILFGGASTEHEVSRISASSVLNNIDMENFEVSLVGIAKNGDWLPYEGSYDKLRDGSWEDEARVFNGIPIGRSGVNLINGIKALAGVDVVFPVLHGFNGEDGTVQGLFELMNIPYVGCGVLASAVCMDKVFTKIILERAGILQAKYVVVYRHIFQKDPEAYSVEIGERLGYPCFVKPANSGSSVGVFKVARPEELIEKIARALEYDRKVVVEEFIDGREIECAVRGNLEPEVTVPGEIVPSKDFYDYEDKYIAGASMIKIPADLTTEEKEDIRLTACRAFKALDCAGLARIDFFYENDTGRIVLNEVNTLPGFTEISMYAKLWNNMGLNFTDLITKLVELAFLRKNENARKNFTYG
jgi:D-alanine-D-alanine ligase